MSFALICFIFAALIFWFGIALALAFVAHESGERELAGYLLIFFWPLTLIFIATWEIGFIAWRRARRWWRRQP